MTTQIEIKEVTPLSTNTIVTFAEGLNLVQRFNSLADTPNGYSGHQGKHVKVNQAQNGLIFADPTFTEQSDTPNDYAGSGGYDIRVKSDETGVEFYDPEHWKQYARGEAEFRAMRKINKNQFAASGHVHFGKVDGLSQAVNEGLWTRQTASDINQCYLGYTSANKEGTSETDFPVTHIAGITSEIDFGFGTYGAPIKFDHAPDGRDTFNVATGERIRHADVATAFAAAAADPDVEVVVDRHDMFGGEFFLEAITQANPFAYRGGIIHNQSATMNGIATSRSNRPVTYYAVFDGDMTSAGLGVDFWAATNEEKIAMLSDESNNLFIIKDELGVDMLVQWRIRQRTVAGVGNGDWGNINPEGGALSQVRPQGSNDTVVAGSFGQGSELGVFTSSLSDEGYFHAWGVVRRLNQGVYHPSFNPLGAAKATDGYWEQSTLLNNTADCFAHATGGNLASGVTGRRDGRFYDAIHAGGDGGVNDHRLSAWDMSSKEEASKVFQKVVSGTYRGEEPMIWTKAIKPTTPTGTPAFSNEYPEFAYYPDIYPAGGSEIHGSNGYWTVNVTQGWVSYVDSNVHPDITTGGSVHIYFDENLTASAGDVIYVVANWNIGSKPYSKGTTSSVSGDFLQVDVLGDPANVLDVPDLSSGWQGGWISKIPDGKGTTPLTRKCISSTAECTYTDDKGATWAHINPPTTINKIENEHAFSNPSGRVCIYAYTAFAKQTVKANGARVLNHYEGLGYVWATMADTSWGGVLLAESIMGKVCKSSSSDYPLGEYTVLDTSGWFDGILTWSSSERDNPVHSNIRLSAPNNNSPAVKALWYQTATNQQASLNLAWNELKYRPTLAPIQLTIGSSTTLVPGQVYYYPDDNVAFGGRMFQARIVTAHNPSNTSYKGYNETRTGKLVRYDGAVDTAFIIRNNGATSGWGDDFTVRIVDNTSNYTNLNGDKCLCGTAQLSKPYGYTRNQARAGKQMTGADL